jgi:hypothetical protein
VVGVAVLGLILPELSLGAVRAVDRELMRLVRREVGAPSKRIVYTTLKSEPSLT